VITGVPFADVVRRTARVRLEVTVTGCEMLPEVVRTARVRDGVVVVVVVAVVRGATVNGDTMLMFPVPLPLLLIIDGSDAAPGTVTFPMARDCVVDGDVMAALVDVVAVPRVG
jgi:hypothetical protein